MQMNALRSANLAKLSSRRSTSDEYCVGSISAGTPGGYCLSQMRSMETPLIDQSPLCLGLASLPSVSSLPERGGSGGGLGQTSGSGYRNPCKWRCRNCEVRRGLASRRLLTVVGGLGGLGRGLGLG